MTYFSQQIPALIFAAGLGAMAASPVFAKLGCDGSGHESHHQQGKQMEQHHHQLHQALKLTAEQEPAWKKLMDSEQPKREMAEAKPGDLAKLSMPERLERRLDRAKAHQEQLAVHLGALKALYQTLTPEQRATFEDFHSAKKPGTHQKSRHHPSGNATPPAKS